MQTDPSGPLTEELRVTVDICWCVWGVGGVGYFIFWCLQSRVSVCISAARRRMSISQVTNEMMVLISAFGSGGLDVNQLWSFLSTLERKRVGPFVDSKPVCLCLLLKTTVLAARVTATGEIAAVIRI